MLSRIYGPIKENCVWKPRHNHELYELRHKSDIVKVIKQGLLQAVYSKYTRRY
jgi:hypothetical protein